MTNKSISIVIPTLNEEKNLDRCLNSIFSQKYSGKIEVLLADGGSIDKTLDITKKYKVKVLKNLKKDAESGKILGLKNATGYYFMILDADMDLASLSWFEKMVKPLEENPEIIGSFTGFVAYKTDSFLSKYITIDSIQRDPLFRYLTPSPEQVVLFKKKNYWLCKYSEDNIVPAGFCLYRRKDLDKLGIFNRNKFMELDTLSLFVKSGLNKFAYVPSTGLHHPFLTDLNMLIRKRVRNLNSQFFNQPDKREFTWINFGSKYQKLKILIWVIYANTLVLPMLVGIYRSLKYKNYIALYEPIFVWITTNLIIWVFLKNKQGRQLIFNRV